jgi:hypothetical protein
MLYVYRARIVFKAYAEGERHHYDLLVVAGSARVATRKALAIAKRNAIRGGWKNPRAFDVESQEMIGELDG